MLTSKPGPDELRQSGPQGGSAHPEARAKRSFAGFPPETHTGLWFWLTLALSSITIVGFVFAVWELIENHLFRDLDYRSLHYLYITRGIASSLLLAFWAAWFVLRERRASERQLRQSREHYRGLLEASPSAVVLYDRERVVLEWNAAAERLYGLGKPAALGLRLATVPAGKEAELDALLEQVGRGKAALDIETQRRHSDGTVVDVQLAILPFRGVSGQNCFLEVTNDIRERVRLRQALLQLEKLTTMGQMAAGTAHHLNTPLASMLLRVQMLRSEAKGRFSRELEQLENGVQFCQQFVRRLLDFSRRPQAIKQPESLDTTLESVAGFMTPQLHAKHARLVLDLKATNGDRVLVDRNQLESLFIILLSNAVDAIAESGSITVRTSHPGPNRIEVAISDDGCGIEPGNLDRIFQPFFSTKPPGKGTGLGLALASTILQEHNGAIRLDSRPKQGTTVHVELPICQATAGGKGVAR